MGMFDNVDYKCDCPKCGSSVSGFQSKDGDCVLETIKPGSVYNFYSSCNNCGVWIDFTSKPSSNFTMKVLSADCEQKILHEHTKDVMIEGDI